MISCPQSIHGFRQFIWNYSALPPNWRDDLSWSSGWFFHSECTSVCDAYWTGPTTIHDKKLSVAMIHQVTNYYTTWIVNLERILSICQNQQEILNYGWDPKVVTYPHELGNYWWRWVTIGILNRSTIISYGLESVGWSKIYVI